MHFEETTRSLTHMLENCTFFCLKEVPLEIIRRQKDRGDVTIVTLSSFKGNFTNNYAVENFTRTNNLLCHEDEARVAKKICVLIAPNHQTAQISYALMRYWCPSITSTIDIFQNRILVPLIAKPHR